MRMLTAGLAMIAGLQAATATAQGQRSEQAEFYARIERVAALGWMAGHWRWQGQVLAGGRVNFGEEVWLAPHRGMMIGLSRSAHSFSPGEFEYMRIEAGPDGVPQLLAQPGGRPAVAFRLVRSSSTEAVFENPAHDYPQRISYARDGEQLVASISTIDGGRPMRWTYRLRATMSARAERGF